MGFLPVYVFWHYNLEDPHFVCGVGSYAAEKPFYKDDPNCRVWCIPFPLNVPFHPFEQGISVLRSCGTPETTVHMLCYERSPQKWIEYFNLQKEIKTEP